MKYIEQEARLVFREDDTGAVQVYVKLPWCSTGAVFLGDDITIPWSDVSVTFRNIVAALDELPQGRYADGDMNGRVTQRVQDPTVGFDPTEPEEGDLGAYSERIEDGDR